MTKKHSTKQSLIASVLVLCLCLTSFVGTTFAWFTDSVSSANNIITSGNLDIKLTHKSSADDEEVTENTKLFDDVALWEPGVMVWEEFTISNEGSLDLKYQFTLNALEATEVTVDGKTYSFADVLKVAVVEEDDFKYTRENVEALTGWKSLESFTRSGKLYDKTEAAVDTADQKASTETFGIIIYWQPTEYDNVFNMNNDRAGQTAQVSVGVDLLATQLNNEEDGFGADYDEDAWHPDMVVYTMEDLAQALANGGKVQVAGTLNAGATQDVPNWTNAPAEFIFDATTLDSLTGGKYVLEQGSRYGVVALISADESLTLSDMKITANSQWPVYLSNYGGTLTLENIDVTATQGAGIYPYGTNGTTTIKNATVNQEALSDEFAAITPWAGTAVATSNGHNLIIEDGTYYGSKWGVYVYNSGANVTINGGTFKAPTVIRADGVWSTGGDKSVVTVNGGNFDGALYLDYGTTPPEIYINGGNFTNFSATVNGQAKLVIKGGTFDADPSAYVADGYQAVENTDGTYTVGLAPLSLAEFLTDLEAANYDYDGMGVTVILKDSEYNHFNNTVRQFYIPASTVNINSDVDTIKIKNVVFTFVDDDTSNNYTAGELQTLAKNVTFEKCTFDKVSVSPWETRTGANDCASATFTGCIWNNLTGRYGVHQSKAATLTVTGCTFNSQRGIHVNTVNNLTVKTNTFNGIADGYGVLCLSEGITAALTSMDVSGNIAEGQTMLRQLSKVITYDQVCSIFENNTYGEGKEYVAGSIVVKDPSWTYLTAENYATSTITSNTKYALEGDFGGQNVSIVMPAGVENVIFDGTNATNINELIIVQNGQLIDNANDVVGERSGNVTVQNFNVLSQINVFACKTEVVVQKNTAEALMIHAGNCAVKVLNNTIDANFESHPTYRNATATWNNNDYGIALNIFEYNLWFEGNTVTDAKSHAIGINGWEGTFDTGKANKIESFTGNNITVNTTSKTDRAAFKVWDDETYASNDAATDVVNATAKAFINAVLADSSNTFDIVDGYNHTIFCFYNVNTNN